MPIYLHKKQRLTSNYLQCIKCSAGHLNITEQFKTKTNIKANTESMSPGHKFTKQSNFWSALSPKILKS